MHSASLYCFAGLDFNVSESILIIDLMAMSSIGDADGAFREARENRSRIQRTMYILAQLSQSLSRPRATIHELRIPLWAKLELASWHLALYFFCEFSVHLWTCEALVPSVDLCCVGEKMSFQMVPLNVAKLWCAVKLTRTTEIVLKQLFGY